MQTDETPFSHLLSAVVDNRGRTCPTVARGIPLIATNCIRNDLLYPTREKLRYVSQQTYEHWFRGHPQPGDLIFVTKGTPGRLCVAPDPVDFCIAQDMVAVRANEHKVYPKYLFALLRSPLIQNRIEQMHVGTLIPHFKKGDFGKLLLPLPDRNTQKFIGDAYFEMSAKIELNRHMNETLETIAKAIFKSWFVDFDPVRGKMAGRQPFGMDAATATLFPASLEQSELGEVPVGWRAGTMGEDFRITMGQSPPGSTYNEDGMGLPFYQGRVDFGFRFPNRRVFCSAPTRFAEKGDTLVTVRAPVGDTNVAMERCCIGRGVAAVRHATGGPSYTYYFIRFLRAVFERFEAEGTVFGAINKKGFNSIRCLLPPSEVVDHFDALCSPIDDQIERKDCESRTLASIRDALLPKLILGELRVKEAERFLKERGL